MHLLYTFLCFEDVRLDHKALNHKRLCVERNVQTEWMLLELVYFRPFTRLYCLIEFLQRNGAWDLEFMYFFFFTSFAKFLKHALKFSRHKGVLKCQRLLMRENRTAAARAITADRPSVDSHRSAPQFTILHSWPIFPGRREWSYLCFICWPREARRPSTMLQSEKAFTGGY